LIIHRAGSGKVRIARWPLLISGLPTAVLGISPAITRARIRTGLPTARMEVAAVTRLAGIR